MSTLIDCLRVKQHDVITLIGSGGKTSLLWLLGTSYSSWCVLLSTSTKMAIEPWRPFHHFMDESDACRNFYPQEPGGYLLAQHLPKLQKLGAFSPDVLREIIPRYDLTVIEGDGSQQLPLKGWAEYEPIVPTETTVSIGVIPVSIIGKPANQQTVHRFPLFSALTGIQEGECIELIHLFHAIVHPNGLWKSAKGARILMLNQAETAIAQENARRLHILLIKANACPSKVIAGSVHQNQGELL